MKYLLKDITDENASLEVEIQTETYGIAIKSPDHGCNEDQESGPIYIELYEGKLRLVVWDDINSPEPKIIDLDSAKLSNFKET